MNSTSSGVRPQLCAVSYLNTIPLCRGFIEGPVQYEAHVNFLLPADCADAVREHIFDAGLVPVIEIARQSLNILSDVGIACRGPVRSILLISRVPAAEIRTLATDSSSRTSVVLTRILLEKYLNAGPLQMISMKPDMDAMLQVADACLIIGDPALRIDPASVSGQVFDIGQLWWEFTGLPMVFAAWAGRGSIPAEIFRKSWEYGMETMDEYIKAEAQQRGLSAETARDYLTRSIHFEIGPEERRGWDAYLRLAATMETIAA